MYRYFEERLSKRKSLDNYRSLFIPSGIDFLSNDYLGLARRFKHDSQGVDQATDNLHGSTGSRLLSGNTPYHVDFEHYIADTFGSSGSLVFSSGYQASLTLLSALTDRNFVFLYDEYIHACFHDGMRLSPLKKLSFRHNDLSDLQNKLETLKGKEKAIVLVESVYSMDGDGPDLQKIDQLCSDFNAYWIVDEAHAIGQAGVNRLGIAEFSSTKNLMAKVITFGKAIGTHGGAILGSSLLIDYLVNFGRGFIYSTAPPVSNLLYTKKSIEYIISQGGKDLAVNLEHNIQYFKQGIEKTGLSNRLIPSNYSIQSFRVSNMLDKRKTHEHAREMGLELRLIKYPTVPKGKDRIRICLHAYNKKPEIDILLRFLNNLED
jgi:8-amino-7-oxononanoate synthase